MAFDIFIISERNETLKELLDSDAVLMKYLSQKHSTDYQLLPYIDRFGNTIFNHLQAKVLIEDLKKLKQAIKSKKDEEFVNELIQLITDILNKPHQYIKFVGD